MARGRPSKKLQILDSARELFVELGYQGTTIDLVVQKAAVSKPTVYGHFPSKQVLWQAMLEQTLEAVEKERSAIEVVGGDWLGTIIEAYRLLAAKPETVAVYRIMLGERHKMADEARRRFEDFESRLELWCGAVLQAEGVALNDEQCFVLHALCREGMLQPALRQRPAPDVARLQQTIARAID